MNVTLLRYYERELHHLREMGGEFATEFPKVASRLGIEAYECADPYVERLLEGFSFLAARIQLKIDAEYPKFTQHLLEIVYPHYLAPTPSMMVAQLQPSLSEGSLKEGFLVPRGTAMRSLLGKGDQTACEFRTAHDVTLWPIEIAEAKYFPYSGEIDGISVPSSYRAQSCLRLRLKCATGMKFSEIPLERLELFLRGSDRLPSQLLEQILAHGSGVLVKPVQTPAPWHELIPSRQIDHMGFDDNQAMLPYGDRSFHGYRLLQEYFAFAHRFMFVAVSGLTKAVAQCHEDEIEVVFLFDNLDTQFEQNVSADNFALHCTPAINLFEKSTDRIQVSDRVAEYHVVPDRIRPLDYEVYQIREVQGYGSGADAKHSFRPFFESLDPLNASTQQTFFQVRREARVASEKQSRDGPRSSYAGNEAFVSLVDALEAPFSPEIRQLGFETLCTNRDLPLSMPLGLGQTDFILDSNAPVDAVRCLSGPTAPRSSIADGSTAWRLISHLSLNYLSIVNSNENTGGTGLRDLLALYCVDDGGANSRQVQGVTSVRSQPIVRRMPSQGPITYGRGVQIRLTVDESAFDFSESGAFLFGSVLERFFAKYVSINSFTETVMVSERRGEIMKWPARIGLCETV